MNVYLIMKTSWSYADEYANAEYTAAPFAVFSVKEAAEFTVNVLNKRSKETGNYYSICDETIPYNTEMIS